jgi:carbon storage regulator
VFWFKVFLARSKKQGSKMLVLSRKKNESIIIGSGEKEIKIKIIEINGNSIRLGFEAPNDISIHREEVYHAIKKDEAKNLP